MESSPAGHGDLRSIGELARTSGLSVSALRFYDRSGVLPPALVDPVTGYRWYTEEQVLPARLVAGLRRVGMPLAGIAAVLRHRDEPAAVRGLLDAHLRRLEDGLADARHELSRVRSLLEPAPAPAATRLVLRRVDLAAALDAVRFAVGMDPDLPMLGAVLFDVDPHGVRLVATDRYRMAFGRAPARVTGPAVRAPVPVAAVDALRSLLTGPPAGAAGPPRADAGPSAGDARTPPGEGSAGGTVTVDLDAGVVTAAVAGQRVRAEVPADDFPDYRRLLRRTVDDRPVRRVPVDVPTLRAALRTAPTVLREHAGTAHRVTVLGLHDRDGLRPLGPGELTPEGPAADGPGPLRVGVNGGYLLDALDAAGARQLVLELDGPIGPLAIRRPDDPDVFSVLMPIRL
ncbi:MerR family transcriptional regulator [Micromonospora rosaria]|uniref:MerR family transcriptional regulator n=1 Tax=Micromonospora rosaria TaxID=47874 RepID=A0A136PWH0_9ACTN|nr:MerR family transcriptional regulator [Micromonospora rosaria]